MQIGASGGNVIYSSPLTGTPIANRRQRGVSFIPGAGWIIGGGYFLANVIVNYETGKDIGEHLDSKLNGGVIADW